MGTTSWPVSAQALAIWSQRVWRSLDTVDDLCQMILDPFPVSLRVWSIWKPCYQIGQPGERLSNVRVCAAGGKQQMSASRDKQGTLDLSTTVNSLTLVGINVCIFETKPRSQGLIFAVSSGLTKLSRCINYVCGYYFGDLKVVAKITKQIPCKH